MDNAAKRKKCKKQSRDLYFSLFSILFWSLAVSIAKSLCKKGSTLNLWYGSSSKVSEDSARGRVTVILCVRSIPISLLDEETAGMRLGCVTMQTWLLWAYAWQHCYTSVLFAIRWMARAPHPQPVSSFGPDRSAVIVPWGWRGHQFLLSFLFWLMLLWWCWCIITPNMWNDVNAYWLCLYLVCSCQFSSIIQQA